MKSRGKVLLFSMEFPPGPGGIGSHAYQLALHLSRANYQPTVVCRQDPASDGGAAAFDALQPFRVLRLNRLFTPVGYLTRILQALFWTAKTRPRWILASGRRGAFYSLLPQLCFRLPRVTVGHGTEFAKKSKWERAVVKLLFKSSSHCVAVSRFTKTLMVQNGLPETKISVIPNGADPAVFTPATRREEDSSSDLMEKKILLTVGRLSRRKGQDIVIRALSHLVKSYPQLLYVMAGPDGEKKRLLDLARDLNVEKHVLIRGIVEQKELLQLYRNAYINILASRIASDGENEGFGISIVEAALMSAPSIGTRGCGTEEVIQHEKTGHLIPMDSPEELAEIIRQYLESPQKRDAMGKGARKYALDHFTWDRIAPRYFQTLDKVYGQATIKC